MSKVAQYLQEHVVGEVITSVDAREYFSTDTSILKLTPQIIVYPREENDVRKIAKFSWQLAEKGRLVPLTARGLGTDQAGAALGQGVMIVFPAHMNKILSLDPKKGYTIVQPGLNFGKLQQTLLTHGSFIPSFPASIEYSTIGGAVANNASGVKSVKYGVTSDYVKDLRVVLANGEVIETGRLSKKELSAKKGLPTFEGEIYRSLDNLLQDSEHVINQNDLGLVKNTAGYDVWDIRGGDGSFDITPLFVGSQGTLGVITEIGLDTEVFSPQTTLLVGYFDDAKKAGEAINKLKALKPSALEIVDNKLLEFLHKHNPNQLKNVVSEPFPKIVMLVEFDNIKNGRRKKNTKKAVKILEGLAKKTVVSTDNDEQEDYWKIRQSAAAIYWQESGNKRALPFIEDAVVPAEKFAEYLEKTETLLKANGIEAAIWGSAGNGNLHLQPFIDLSQVGGRQTLFKLMDQYYSTIIEMGGSTSGQHNDGRMRAPYLKKLYGSELYNVFSKIKQIFDPYGTMNPGVKMDVQLKDVQQLVRDEYSLNHLYDHMPRT